MKAIYMYIKFPEMVRNVLTLQVATFFFFCILLNIKLLWIISTAVQTLVDCQSVNTWITASQVSLARLALATVIVEDLTEQRFSIAHQSDRGHTQCSKISGFLNTHIQP